MSARQHNAYPETLTVMEGITPDTIPFDDLFAANGPVLLPGLVKHWPLVQAAGNSPQAVMSSLQEHDAGHPFLAYRGAPNISARFGYNATATGFNFTSERVTLPQVFDDIRRQWQNHEHDYVYVNSLKLTDGFPALAGTHTLNFSHPEFTQNQPVAKIWLGTESVAAAHFDQPRNLACCVQGKRRFTLFAPDQVDNLYPGPLHPTPGGQVVTMANLGNPDLTRFPRLEQALDAAIIVDMQPGDALYYPSMWWHEVEAFDRFNVMINFWWMSHKQYTGNPMDVLLHGMMSLRDKPENEKQAWKALFDYYVFGDASRVTAHLPEPSHGPLGPMDDSTARRLRAMLLQNLNR